MRETTRITRVKLADNIKQLALMECAYRCSVPRCQEEWPGLQFQHISGDVSDEEPSNLLVVCPAHFEMISDGEIKESECTKLKEVLQVFGKYDADEVEPIRNRLLYSLAGELWVNLNILKDDKFEHFEEQADRPMIYPRLMRTVLDQCIASGTFVHAHDQDLFEMLHKWSEIQEEFNRRLDLTEIRSLAVNPATASAQPAIVYRRSLEVTRKQARGLAVYLLEEYGTQAGLDFSTLFAEAGIYQRQG